MSKKDFIFQIADHQQGFFTSNQAEECGYRRSNFHRYISSGEWIKEQRGIYRLAHYPVTDRPELVLWCLWSCNRLGHPQGVWSHDTALDIYELSDVMPAKMHLSVPKRFRKGIEIPKSLVLHFADIPESDIRSQQGYRITTPLRTLIDVIEEAKLSNDLIVQAIRDAIQKGLVSRKELIDSQSQNINSKLIRLMNDSKI